MEKKHKELLRQFNVELADELSPDIATVTRWLCSKTIITERMRDVVLAETLPKDKAFHLLEQILPKRGPHAFEALYVSAIETKLFGVADILKPENAPHQPTPNFSFNSNVPASSESSDSEPIPDVWPPAQAPESIVVNVKTVNSFNKGSSKYKKYMVKYRKALSPQGQESKYLMKNKRRGVAIVINNKKFDYSDPRDGTDRDRQALDYLFRQMGFEFVVKSNQTKEEMEKIFLEQSKRNFSDVDCLAVVVLSHGEKSVVFGTDGKLENGQPINCIEISWITNLFCGNDSLISKPKLFFMQACQGKRKDAGVAPGLGAGDGRNGTLQNNPSTKNSTGPPTANRSVSKDNVDSHLPTGDAGPESNLTAPKVPIQQEERDEDININESPLDYLTNPQSDAFGEKKGSVADVFIAMATPPDFLSWRRPDFGTWFIQAVVEVFSKSAYRLSLLDLMTKVTRMVQKAETKHGSYKQVVEVKSTLDRALYFFPDLFEGTDEEGMDVS